MLFLWKVCKIALENHADNEEVVRQLKNTIGVFSPANVVSGAPKEELKTSVKIQAIGSPKTKNRNPPSLNISSSFSSLSLARK